MSGVRTFIGIPLPDEARDALMTACEAVRASDRHWRGEKWVPRENLHITLKFLGDVAEDAAAPLADAVGEVADSHHGFRLLTSELRTVPNAHRARMIWCTFLDPDGECAALVDSLDRACVRFGARPEDRAFAPHATLVRARTPRPLSAAALEEAMTVARTMPSAMSVPSITLFASRLTPGGPVYSALRECTLGPA